MNDIGLYIEDGHIDLTIENNDLKADDGLETAALISLFSDKRALPEEIPQGQTTRRGWWGDMFSESDGDKIGSKLWLLEREKQTQETLSRAEDFSEEAFDWMLEDGVTASVTSQAQYTSRGQMQITLAIAKPKGLSQQFSLIWDAQSLRRS